MSLDINLDKVVRTTVFSGNITHNLNRMADAAGLYDALWHPEHLCARKAADLIGHLTKGLDCLKSDPDRFRALGPKNGWGTYEALVEFVERYLAACTANPDGEIQVCR